MVLSSLSYFPPSKEKTKCWTLIRHLSKLNKFRGLPTFVFCFFLVPLCPFYVTLLTKYFLKLGAIHKVFFRTFSTQLKKSYLWCKRMLQIRNYTSFSFLGFYFSKLMEVSCTSSFY